MHNNKKSLSSILTNTIIVRAKRNVAPVVIEKENQQKSTMIANQAVALYGVFILFLIYNYV